MSNHSLGGSVNNSENKSRLDIIHNPATNRFEIQLGDGLAFLEYQIRNDNMIFIHTETPPQYEGKGFGGRLARAGLEFAKEHFYRVVPLCPFVEAYIARHPEYKMLVRK